MGAQRKVAGEIMIIDQYFSCMFFTSFESIIKEIVFIRLLGRIVLILLISFVINSFINSFYHTLAIILDIPF